MADILIDNKIRILWSNLNCDPRSRGFLDQKVSIGTPECPEGSRIRDNRWIFPAEICTKHRLKHRMIDFDIRLGKKSLLDPEYTELLAWTKRYMVALLSRPNRNILHLASVQGEYNFVKAFIVYLATKCRGNGDTSLASMSQKQAATFAASMSAAWKAENSFLKFELFIRRIQKYGDEGLTGDLLSLDAFRAIILTCNTKLSAAKHWSITKAAEAEAEEELIPYPPLPDEYCRRTLEIAQFFRSKLATHLVAHARKYMELFEKNEHAGYGDWARSYVWPVSELPFEHTYHFPPTDWRQTSLLITIMQSANAQEVLLFTGARTSEFLMMNQKCLSSGEDGDDLVHSIRFKNVASLGGIDVTWPAPQGVVDAVTVQIDLAKAAGAASALWLSPRTLSRPLVDNVVPMLNRFARFHKLNPEIGGAKTVNVQRFRPTIARLVYLAEGADIRLVKRVLGHRWVTTTIAYLQMSPFIQQELNLNRYPAGDNPSLEEGPTRAEMELTPKSLSSLLLALEHQGRRLYAVGPGVLVTTDGTSPPDEVAPMDATEALSFVIDWMTKPPVRRDTRVFEWLTGEAKRIVSADKVDYRPPTNRHQFTYDSIIKGSLA